MKLTLTQKFGLRGVRPGDSVLVFPTEEKARDALARTSGTTLMSKWIVNDDEWVVHEE